MKLGTSELGWHAANSELDGLVLPREEYRNLQVEQAALVAGKAAVASAEQVFSNYARYSDNLTGPDRLVIRD